MYKIYNELFEQLSPETKEILKTFEKKYKRKPELEEEFLSLYPSVKKNKFNDSAVRYYINLNGIDLVFNRFYTLFSIHEKCPDNSLYVTTIKDSRIKTVFYENYVDYNTRTSKIFMSNYYNKEDIKNNKIDMIVDFIHNNNDIKINKKDIIDTLELVFDINSKMTKSDLEKIVEHQVKIKNFLNNKNNKITNKI